MQNPLEEVAQATSLREGAEGVATVLRLIHKAGKLTLKELSRQSGIPVPVLAAVRRELQRAQMLDREGGLVLSAGGRRFVEEELGVLTRHDPTCPTCGGQGIVVAPELELAVEKLEGYNGEGPPVDVTLDQAPCWARSSLRRALFMHHTGALEGKRVLILGDDDLVSVAVALLGRALGRPQLSPRLTVVEVDPRRVQHLTRVGAEEEVEIEVVQHDLRDPLPTNLRCQFDTFETDPSYTRQGARLFVSRGIQALKPGLGGQGFLSFGPRAPDGLLELHADLTTMGLAVRQVLPGFNDYIGASLLGGKSQWIHLVTTSRTRALVSESRFEEALYTGQVTPTLRLYRCTECRAEYEVGQGSRFTTIEDLKKAGCPTCSNGRFRYLRRQRSRSTLATGS